MPNSPGNPVANYWRGRYNLFLSTVLFLIGLRIAIGWLQAVFPTSANSLALTTWLGLSLIVLVWQLIGGWRACDNHLRSGGGMVAGWLGYASLLITLSLATVQMIDGITGQVDLQPAPPAETVALELLDGESAILVDKPLNWALYTTFKQALQQHESIKTVVLDSTGGHVFTARGMALLIEQYKLDTHIVQTCYSACTLVFMAGDQRSMNAGAELGFHQYSMHQQNPMQNIDIGAELDKDKNYFTSRGASTQFVRAVFRADPDSLWKPNRKLLVDAGVITTK